MTDLITEIDGTKVTALELAATDITGTEVQLTNAAVSYTTNTTTLKCSDATIDGTDMTGLVSEIDGTKVTALELAATDITGTEVQLTNAAITYTTNTTTLKCSDATIDGTDMTDLVAEIDGTKVTALELAGTDITGTEVQLTNAVITYATNATTLKCSDATIDAQDMTDLIAEIDGTKVTALELAGTDITGTEVQLTNASITYATNATTLKCSDATIDAQDMTDLIAEIDGTKVTALELAGTDITGTEVQLTNGAITYATNATTLKCSDATIDGTDMTGLVAEIDGTKVTALELAGTDITGTEVQLTNGAITYATNATTLKCSDATIDGTDMTGLVAEIDGTKVTALELAGTDITGTEVQLTNGAITYATNATTLKCSDATIDAQDMTDLIAEIDGTKVTALELAGTDITGTEVQLTNGAITYATNATTLKCSDATIDGTDMTGLVAEIDGTKVTALELAGTDITGTEVQLTNAAITYATNATTLKCSDATIDAQDMTDLITEIDGTKVTALELAATDITGTEVQLTNAAVSYTTNTTTLKCSDATIDGTDMTGLVSEIDGTKVTALQLAGTDITGTEVQLTNAAISYTTNTTTLKCSDATIDGTDMTDLVAEIDGTKVTALELAGTDITGTEVQLTNAVITYATNATTLKCSDATIDGTDMTGLVAEIDGTKVTALELAGTDITGTEVQLTNASITYATNATTLKCSDATIDAQDMTDLIAEIDGTKVTALELAGTDITGTEVQLTNGAISYATNATTLKCSDATIDGTDMTGLVAEIDGTKVTALELAGTDITGTEVQLTNGAITYATNATTLKCSDATIDGTDMTGLVAEIDGTKVTALELAGTDITGTEVQLTNAAITYATNATTLKCSDATIDAQDMTDLITEIDGTKVTALELAATDITGTEVQLTNAAVSYTTNTTTLKCSDATIDGTDMTGLVSEIDGTKVTALQLAGTDITGTEVQLTNAAISYTTNTTTLKCSDATIDGTDMTDLVAEIDGTKVTALELAGTDITGTEVQLTNAVITYATNATTLKCSDATIDAQDMTDLITEIDGTKVTALELAGTDITGTEVQLTNAAITYATNATTLKCSDATIDAQDMTDLITEIDGTKVTALELAGTDITGTEVQLTNGAITYATNATTLKCSDATIDGTDMTGLVAEIDGTKVTALELAGTDITGTEVQLTNAAITYATNATTLKCSDATIDAQDMTDLITEIDGTKVTALELAGTDITGTEVQLTNAAITYATNATTLKCSDATIDAQDMTDLITEIDGTKVTALELAATDITGTAAHLSNANVTYTTTNTTITATDTTVTEAALTNLIAKVTGNGKINALQLSGSTSISGTEAQLTRTDISFTGTNVELKVTNNTISALEMTDLYSLLASNIDQITFEAADVGSIVGSATQLANAKIDIANNPTVTIDDNATLANVAQANLIDTKTTKAITATIKDTVANFSTGVADANSNNAYTLETKGNSATTIEIIDAEAANGTLTYNSIKTVTGSATNLASFNPSDYDLLLNIQYTITSETPTLANMLTYTRQGAVGVINYSTRLAVPDETSIFSADGSALFANNIQQFFNKWNDGRIEFTVKPTLTLAQQAELTNINTTNTIGNANYTV